jgi:hypothetical protein
MRRRDFLLTSAAGALAMSSIARAADRFTYREATLERRCARAWMPGD